MKVLYCSAYYKKDIKTGANIRYEEIGKCLSRRDDITYLTCESTPPESSAPHISVPRIFWSRIFCSLYIRWCQFSGRFDAVITDLVPTVPGKRVFYLIHDLRQFTKYRRHVSKASDFLFRLNLTFQKNIITVSEFSAGELKRLGCSPEDILVSYNGVNPELVQRFRMPREGQSVDILYVATFEKRKNHHTLVSALGLIKHQIPNVRCVLVGRDLGCLAEIKGLVRSLDLCTNVKIIESCTEKEIHQLYKEAKIFVSPSLYEGFGMPVVEAESAGLRVVCSDIEVFREVGSDNCRFFDPEDPVMLANIVSEELASVGSSEKGSGLRPEFCWEEISRRLREEIFRRTR